jgi:hypothetical protein
MVKYNVGDVVIRTGQTWNGRLAIITEIVKYRALRGVEVIEYRIEFIDYPKVSGLRWSPRFFKLYQSVNREPDWEV